MSLMEVDPTVVSDGLTQGPPIIYDMNGMTTGPTRRSRKGRWTAEKDEMLRTAVKKFEGKNWKKIAECFKDDRTDFECLNRWQKVLNPELVKGPWRKKEDEELKSLVEKYGAREWSTIAEHLSGRIGKQCRERWHNHLNPAINKGDWTRNEEIMLIRAHEVHGNKWAELTKILPGRTNNAIKNHWNSSLSKRLDAFKKSGLLEQFQPTASSRTQQCGECSQASTSIRCSQSNHDNGEEAMLAYTPDEEYQQADMSEAFVADDKTLPAEDLQNENNPGSDLDKFFEQDYSSGEPFDLPSFDFSQDSEIRHLLDFNNFEDAIGAQDQTDPVLDPLVLVSHDGFSLGEVNGTILLDQEIKTQQLETLPLSYEPSFIPSTYISFQTPPCIPQLMMTESVTKTRSSKRLKVVGDQSSNESNENPNIQQEPIVLESSSNNQFVVSEVDITQTVDATVESNPVIVEGEVPVGIEKLSGGVAIEERKSSIILELENEVLKLRERVAIKETESSRELLKLEKEVLKLRERSSGVAVTETKSYTELKLEKELLELRQRVAFEERNLSRRLELEKEALELRERLSPGVAGEEESSIELKLKKWVLELRKRVVALDTFPRM